MTQSQALRVGIGGPVGSGKTALTLALCLALRDKYDIAVVTNDIYTAEDAQFLVRNEALAPDRIIGVETGGCPHTAIREDASINLEAVDRLNRRFPGLEIIFVESGGDNLAATFSPELSDLTLYVIDVSAGDKIPRKGWPGITRSDLLVINKIDLAPLVGASLEVMDRDAKKMRGARPFVFSNQKTGQGLTEIIAFIEQQGLLATTGARAAATAAAGEARIGRCRTRTQTNEPFIQEILMSLARICAALTLSWRRARPWPIRVMAPASPRVLPTLRWLRPSVGNGRGRPFRRTTERHAALGPADGLRRGDAGGRPARCARLRNAAAREGWRHRY